MASIFGKMDRFSLGDRHVGFLGRQSGVQFTEHQQDDATMEEYDSSTRPEDEMTSRPQDHPGRRSLDQLPHDAQARWIEPRFGMGEKPYHQSGHEQGQKCYEPP
jgi:hypothetical protein